MANLFISISNTNMIGILNLLSTREIALIIMISFYFLFILILDANKVCKVIKRFFVPVIMCSILLLAFYIIGTLYILNHYHWNISLTKDSVIWFIVSGIPYFFILEKAAGINFFLTHIKVHLKRAFIFEFIVNLYTFPLWLELLFNLLFLMIYFRYELIIQKSENERKSFVVNSIIMLGGFSIIIFVLYNSIIDYKNLLSDKTLFSLLLPIWLSIITLPFYYLYTLYLNYESLFVIFNFVYRKENKSIRKNFFIASIIQANLSIAKIKRIRSSILQFNPKKHNPNQFIRSLDKKNDNTILEKMTK